MVSIPSTTFNPVKPQRCGLRYCGGNPGNISLLRNVPSSHGSVSALYTSNRTEEEVSNYEHIDDCNNCTKVVQGLLLLRRLTLNGDACCPHESGCPPQLL